MPRRAKAKGLYRRGPYWLDWDRKRDGTLRSPNLAVFHYDAGTGRIRSASAGTPDVEGGKLALDRIYLQGTRGDAICPTCGQRRVGGIGYLVTSAIADYHASIGSERASAKAIAARLDHIVSYIASLASPAVTCEQVDGAWIERFRAWAAKQPIVSPTGKTRQRSLGTIENSVLQLAAAITAAHRRGDAARPAQFRAIPVKSLANTPRRRLSIAELADAFRFASDPRYPGKRHALLRFLQISVATAARPDAAHDVSTEPARAQWQSDKRVLALNYKGRRQTKKYRATVRLPWQVARLLDQAKPGLFVPTKSVRGAFDSMCEDLGWPKDGENGTKLIRRSIAQLLRDPARGVPAEQLELQLGHRRLDSVTDLYAAFDPAYLREATAALEGIIDEIEARVPGAFHRSDTGKETNIVPIVAAKKAR